MQTISSPRSFFIYFVFKQLDRKFWGKHNSCMRRLRAHERKNKSLKHNSKCMENPNFEISVEQSLNLEKASFAAEESCFSWALKKIFGGRIKGRWVLIRLMLSPKALRITYFSWPPASYMQFSNGKRESSAIYAGRKLLFHWTFEMICATDESVDDDG